MTTSEKVAYLKGLIEGMGIDTQSEQGKLFSVIADVLEDLASDIKDLEENSYDLAEEIDALSDDLADVEDIIYDCDDDDDEDDFRCSGCSGAAVPLTAIKPHLPSSSTAARPSEKVSAQSYLQGTTSFPVLSI